MAGGRYLTYTVRGETRLYVDRRIVHQAAETAIGHVLGAPGLFAAAAEAHQAMKVAEAAARSPGKDIEGMRLEAEELRRLLDDLLIREQKTTDMEEAGSISRVRAAHRDRLSFLARELQGLQFSPERQGALSRLIEELPGLLSAGPDGWQSAPEAQKRTLVQAFLSQLLVRITPRKKPEPYVREVAVVEYQAWLEPLLKNVPE